MSDRPFRPNRTASNYPPTRHLPTVSLRAYTAMLAFAPAMVVLASYPMVSLAAIVATAVFVLVARTVATRASWSTLRVGVPGMPVEVTVARTTRD